MGASNILLIFLFIIVSTAYGDTVTNIPSFGKNVVDDDAIKIGDAVKMLRGTIDLQNAFQFGSGVRLKAPENRQGEIDVILTNGFLELEVDFKSCTGISLICYNSTDKQDQLNELCFNGFCGFQVQGTEARDSPGYVNINDYHSYRKEYLKSCESNIIRMQYWMTIFCYDSNKHNIKYALSCAPAMDSQNKIHIIVRKMNPNCQITIKNALLLDPRTTTTSSTLPSTIPTTLPSTKPPKVEDASVVKVWWFWLIIGVSLFIILFGVLIIIMIWKELCCFAIKKPKQNANMVVQPPPPPQFGQPPATPIEIVTSGLPPPIETTKVPSKDAKNGGNANEESISTNQAPQLPPTTAAVSSTPVKAEKEMPKKKDTVAADNKKVQPRKQNLEKPRHKESKPASKPPPSATSESQSNRKNQPLKPPYRSKGTVAADKKVSPSKPPVLYDKLVHPTQSRQPPPPTSSITSETVSNQNHPQKTDGSKLSNISSMKFKTTTVDE